MKFHKGCCFINSWKLSGFTNSFGVNYVLVMKNGSAETLHLTMVHYISGFSDFVHCLSTFLIVLICMLKILI